MNKSANHVGYTQELLVLPFDHRASFQEKLFGIKGTPTADETRLVASYKMIIYDGFEKAVASGLPKEKMGILVDEQFGTDVIAKAKKHGFTVSVCAEKSGQDEFDFEHADYQTHIKQVAPHLVKVLVRYNPEGDKALNERQAAKLADLGRFLHQTGVSKYMFELLVPATDAQLERCKGDKKVYDVELRPGLMVRAIRELQAMGVEADVWKLEGLDRRADFEAVCAAAREGGRTDVGCIVLGRGESAEKVRDWLKVGADVAGVIGFAVGRTVFWEPLKAFKENKISRDEAVKRIADTYTSFCKLWLDARPH